MCRTIPAYYNSRDFEARKGNMQPGIRRDGAQADTGVPTAINPSLAAMQTWTWTKLGLTVTETKPNRDKNLT